MPLCCVPSTAHCLHLEVLLLLAHDIHAILSHQHLKLAVGHVQRHLTRRFLAFVILNAEINTLQQ